MLGKVERLARAKDPRVIQVMAGLASEYDVVLIARSDGTLAADVRPLVRLSVTVIAEQVIGGKSRREVGSAGGGGRFGLAYFDAARISQYVDEAVHAALTNLEARAAPAGEMTVVLGSGWPGILLHEAIGHGLEGDFNRKGSSAFAGKVGERVASKGVTVVDDGTLAQRRGSLNVDDEGNPTQNTVLIEDGVLRGYLANAERVRVRGAELDFSMIVLLHEYAHHFLISSSSFALPRWLSEGQAEFFASASFERDGTVGLGRPAFHRAGELFYGTDVKAVDLLDPELRVPFIKSKFNYISLKPNQEWSLN